MVNNLHCITKTSWIDIISNSFIKQLNMKFFILLKIICVSLLPLFSILNCVATSPIEKEIRVLCYNVRNCRGMDDFVNYDRTADAIKHLSPDVVAIQELDSATLRSGGDYVLRELADRTQMHYVFAPGIEYQNGKYGIGVLSKEKPVRHFYLPLPGREEKRVLQVVEFEYFVIANCHLSLNEADRISSIKIICETLDSISKPLFLAGDFNSTPTSEPQISLQKSYDYLSDVAQFTSPSVNPKRCIDYICIKKSGQNCILKDRRVISDAITSDHLPLYVDVVMSIPNHQ